MKRRHERVVKCKEREKRGHFIFQTCCLDDINTTKKMEPGENTTVITVTSLSATLSTTTCIPKHTYSLWMLSHINTQTFVLPVSGTSSPSQDLCSLKKIFLFNELQSKNSHFLICLRDIEADPPEEHSRSFRQARTSSAAQSQALPSSFSLRGVICEHPAPPPVLLCLGGVFFLSFLAELSLAPPQKKKLAPSSEQNSPCPPLLNPPLPPPPPPPLLCALHSLIFHALGLFVWDIFTQPPPTVLGLREDLDGT